MKNNKGFTLIELMMVCGLITVLASIAMPNLLRSKVQANEAAAIGNIRAITGAQISYLASNSQFAVDFADMTEPTPSFLSGNWEAPKSGYTYELDGSPSFYTLTATPVDQNITGCKSFYSDCSSVIRYNAHGPADQNSTPLGEKTDAA